MEKAVEQGKSPHPRSQPSVTDVPHNLIEFLRDEHAKECLKEAPSRDHDY